jgi:hypothetical protein
MHAAMMTASIDRTQLLGIPDLAAGNRANGAG